MINLIVVNHVTITRLSRTVGRLREILVSQKQRKNNGHRRDEKRGRRRHVEFKIDGGVAKAAHITTTEVGERIGKITI